MEEECPSVEFNDFDPSSPEMDPMPESIKIKEELPSPPLVIVEKRPVRTATLKRALLVQEEVPAKKRSCKPTQSPAKAAPAAPSKENDE